MHIDDEITDVLIAGYLSTDAAHEDYHAVRHAAGEVTLRQTRAQAALSAPGPDAEALRQVLSAAFRSRNPHRYLATLLIGRPNRERRAHRP